MRPQLPKSFIQAHQRERIMRAIAAVCSRESFHSVTVTKIVSQAGIARNTFYENFPSKDECFRAAFLWGCSMLEEHCIEATSPAAASEGIVSVIEEGPELIRLVLVEGPLGALDLHTEALDRFAAFAGAGELGQMTVGGAAAILTRHLREPTDDLQAQLSEFVGRALRTAVVA